MKKVVSYILILLVIFTPNIVYAKNDVIVKKVTLEKCVDGDTATFKDESGNKFKTRFLAIDTPESVHPTKEVQAYGKEASTYTCNKLTNAETIEIETDENSDQEDKYGRYLAWIFVDGELLQNELINEGLAKVSYLYGDYKYTELLQETETKAKEKKIGIWSIEETPKKKETKTTTSKTKKKTKKKEKNFIEDFFDGIKSFIADCIDDLIDSIASVIESMI